MSYFEVPPQPEPHDGIIEEWYSAPDDELGTEIGINKLLATSPTGRITIRSIVAFSTGFEVRLLAEWAKELSDDLEGSVVHSHSDHFLRVAVEYDDGSRTTNMDSDEPDDDTEDDDEPPTPPFMGYHHPQFMHPHGTERALSFWIWSIPVQGDVTVVCEWVAAEIPVVRFILEGDELR
ncbi:MAG TPA: hypothetical protein VG265_10875, partial [Gaiellaceae bacterium]|nr:hypothetical protein [Gaiellaceae bacterium]